MTRCFLLDLLQWCLWCFFNSDGILFGFPVGFTSRCACRCAVGGCMPAGQKRVRAACRCRVCWRCRRRRRSACAFSRRSPLSARISSRDARGGAAASSAEPRVSRLGSAAVLSNLGPAGNAPLLVMRKSVAWWRLLPWGQQRLGTAVPLLPTAWVAQKTEKRRHMSATWLLVLLL